MTKTEAINHFGGVPALARALGITRHAIYQWPDQLQQATVDRVNGAAVRLGKQPIGAPNNEDANYVLLWDLYQEGFDPDSLRLRRSDIERRLEEKDMQFAELQKKLQHLEEFMRIQGGR